MKRNFILLALLVSCVPPEEEGGKFIRSHTGLNQFVSPQGGDTGPNKDVSLEGYLDELEDGKFSVYRIKYNDFIRNEIRAQYKTAIEETIRKGKHLVIPFGTFVKTNEAYRETARDLNNMLKDFTEVEKARVIVNILNEADRFQYEGEFLPSPVDSTRACPPVSPLMSGSEAPTYMARLRELAEIAREEIDSGIRLSTTVAWMYDDPVLDTVYQCPGWDAVPLDSYASALGRFELFFDNLEPYIDVMGINFYGRPESWAYISTFKTGLEGLFPSMPLIIEEMGVFDEPEGGNPEPDRPAYLTAMFEEVTPSLFSMKAIYYGREDEPGSGVKLKDGTEKASYGVIPGTQIQSVSKFPVWCRILNTEGEKTVCDLFAQRPEDPEGCSPDSYSGSNSISLRSELNGQYVRTTWKEGSESYVNYLFANEDEMTFQTRLDLIPRPDMGANCFNIKANNGKLVTSFGPENSDHRLFATYDDALPHRDRDTALYGLIETSVSGVYAIRSKARYRYWYVSSVPGEELRVNTETVRRSNQFQVQTYQE